MLLQWNTQMGHFWDLERAFRLERCPDFRGEILLHWDKTKCLDVRVSTFRGYAIVEWKMVMLHRILREKSP